MNKLSEKKPERSGTFYIQYCFIPGVCHDTYKFKEPSFEEEWAEYNKDTDTWIIEPAQFDCAEIKLVHGKYTSQYKNTNIGDNLLITYWEFDDVASKWEDESPESEETYFPEDIEFPYKGKDGKGFPFKRLAEFYDEFCSYTELFNELYDKEKGGYKITDEQRFFMFKRWNSLVLPIYKPKKDIYTVTDLFSDYVFQGEGYYLIVNDNIVRADILDEADKEWSNAKAMFNFDNYIVQNILFLFHKELYDSKVNHKEISDKWKNIINIYLEKEKEFTESFRRSLEKAGISESDIDNILKRTERYGRFVIPAKYDETIIDRIRADSFLSEEEKEELIRDVKKTKD